MAALVILALFLVLGVCGVLGWTADSRDPRFGLWPMQPALAKQPVGNMPAVARRHQS